MEKTKHYLLLREKLESTLLSGLESLQSGVSEELNEPHQAPEADREAGSSSEITTERQKELAAKVSPKNCQLRFDQGFEAKKKGQKCSKSETVLNGFLVFSVLAAAHSLLQ